MEKLLFGAPINCRSESYTTVRLGDKWAKKVKTGTTKVQLEDTEGTMIGTAEIVDVWLGPLGAIPAILLEQEHDPVCRTWSGLQAVLQGVYDQPMPADTEVTCLRLRYTGSLIQTATAADLPPEPSSFGNAD